MAFEFYWLDKAIQHLFGEGKPGTLISVGHGKYLVLDTAGEMAPLLVQAIAPSWGSKAYTATENGSSVCPIKAMCRQRAPVRCWGGSGRVGVVRVVISS